MTYGDLKKIAEKLEIGLLEKLATEDIRDYCLEVIPDDHKIEIYIMKNPRIKRITATLISGGK